ncbi:hypothetical protein L9F63_001673, partial [Diploptera punctata]
GDELKSDAPCIIIAHKNVRIVGKTNPGGHDGKKEVPPAQHNRFTDIWCESCKERSDLDAVIEHNLNSCLFLEN